jgi:hypothetical protein
MSKVCSDARLLIIDTYTGNTGQESVGRKSGIR